MKFIILVKVLIATFLFNYVLAKKDITVYDEDDITVHDENDNNQFFVVYSNGYDTLVNNNSENEKKLKNQDTFKDLGIYSDHIRELDIYSTELTQTNIDDIANITTLKYLKLDKCTLLELNYEPLRNLKLRELILISDKGEFPYNFIKEFNLHNMSKIYIDNITDFDIEQKEEIKNICKENKNKKNFVFIINDKNICNKINTTEKTTTTTKTTTITTTTKTTTTITNIIKSNPTISTNDRCGKDNGNTICPNDKCCSKYGWCGTSDAHCGTGCQSEFGYCNLTSSNKANTTKKMTTTKKTTTIKMTYPTDYNYYCGRVNGNEVICPNNECCSEHGWCGTSDAFCGKGCQSDFGRCN